MTDEQIIQEYQAFVNSVNAGGKGEIAQGRFGDILDLINRQKAELSALYKIMNKQDDEISELYRKVASRENLEESFQKTTREFDKRLEKTVKSERREAIKEFADKINELLARYSHLHNNAENARQDIIEAVDGTDIEMQSVWDVFTLKNNEMVEYEKMSRLQENIETIANERLLREIEKDFRLLVKEMTDVDK